jgi:hypothetical protein
MHGTIQWSATKLGKLHVRTAFQQSGAGNDRRLTIYHVIMRESRGLEPQNAGAYEARRGGRAFCIHNTDLVCRYEPLRHGFYQLMLHPFYLLLGLRI